MSSSLSDQARRECVRQYKQSFPPLGVYVLRCDAAGVLRVGSSRNVDGLLNRLRFELTRGTHLDKAVQQAWKTHGAQAFTFEVIDRVTQRADPGFDHDAELAAMLALWRAELCPVSTSTHRTMGSQS